MRTPFVQFDPHFTQNNPQRGQPLQPYKAVIIQDEYQHNKARLIISGHDWNGDKYETGLPATITWGWVHGSSAQMNGYIEFAHHAQNVGHVSKSLVDIPKVEMEVVVLDASWVQKQPQFFIYKNRTVPQVISIVVNQFKLAVVIEDHPQVWPTLSQHGGESTWDFMVRISRMIGFVLIGNGTTIYCMTRQKLIDRAFGAGYVPVFGERPSPILAIMRTTVGQENPDSQYRRYHAWGIDQRSGRVVRLDEDVNADKTPAHFLGSVTYDPLFDRHHTTRSIDNLGTGQAVLKGAALDHEFFHRAEIMVTGDPKIRPGTVLFLDKTYGDRVSGYWYVHRAEHHVQIGFNELQLTASRNLTQSYFCRLTIGRDSLGINGNPPTRRVHIPGSGGRRPGRGGGSGGGGGTVVIPPSDDPGEQSRIDTDPTPPPTVLVQDLWRSAYSQRRCN